MSVSCRACETVDRQWYIRYVISSFTQAPDRRKQRSFVENPVSIVSIQ